ncbi:chymotrypsinogen B-like [Thomomys bottae]
MTLSPGPQLSAGRHLLPSQDPVPCSGTFCPLDTRPEEASALKVSDTSCRLVYSRSPAGFALTFSVEGELGLVQEWASSDLGPGRLILSCTCGIEGCGKPAIPPVVSGLPRVINGEDAVPGSWPWQVSLQYEGFPYCSGTLISEYWVLTAAHCEVTTADKVVAGKYYLAPGEDVQVLDIEKVIPNCNYFINYTEDIALVKLATPARFTDTVSPVCLACAKRDFPPGTPCVVTGWGLVNYEEYESATKLQQAVLPLVSTPECQAYFDDTITDDMICAGGHGNSPCLGDSGGPLVCKKGKVWSQVGIVSWGGRACPVNKPAVFTRITALLPWVKKILAEN